MTDSGEPFVKMTITKPSVKITSGCYLVSLIYFGHLFALVSSVTAGIGTCLHLNVKDIGRVPSTILYSVNSKIYITWMKTDSKDGFGLR